MSLVFQANATLQPYNSLAIPARAKVLVTAQSVVELTEALNYARRYQLSVLVLGEGSNTVFNDDFDGLVILNRLLGIRVVNEQPGYVDIEVAAGENWHCFVDTAIERGWFGLENLALIPGLVGAAPIQNIGAYGVEVKETILGVEFLKIDTAERMTLTNPDCKFEYRDSIFKQSLANVTIITSVTFRLSREASSNISYPALAKRFSSPPTPRQVFDAVCEIRSSKLPLPSEIPNAGSFFKNPVIDADQFAALKLRYPDVIGFEVADGIKLAAAWLIENAGWKEREIGGVTVHQQQALVIINPDHQNGQKVLHFAKALQDDIAEKYGIVLEIEPRIY